MLHVNGKKLLKKRFSQKISVLACLGITILWSGCQSSRSTSLAPLSLGDVSPLYAAAPQWNDFYLASSVTTVCSGTELNCNHGGELKNVLVTGRSTCSGLSMTAPLDPSFSLEASRPKKV